MEIDERISSGSDVGELTGELLDVLISNFGSDEG